MIEVDIIMLYGPIIILLLIFIITLILGTILHKSSVAAKSYTKKLYDVYPSIDKINYTDFKILNYKIYKLINILLIVCIDIMIFISVLIVVHYNRSCAEIEKWDDIKYLIHTDSTYNEHTMEDYYIWMDNKISCKKYILVWTEDYFTAKYIERTSEGSR